MDFKKITNLFTEHPHTVGESYLTHMRFAAWSGIQLTCAGLACIIHSIFPFLFIHTASNVVTKIYNDMQNRKQK